MVVTSRAAPAVEGATRSQDTRGELQLACAVLETAFNDLSSDSSSELSKRARFEARLFCTAIDGEWAKSRRHWCDLAGIEETAFVRASNKVVANTPTVVELPPKPARGGRNYARKGHHNGGQSGGEANSQAVLTNESVRAMRVVLAAGVSIRTTAKQFGVGLATVCDIKAERAWVGV